jgi:hypothetical protein
MYAHTLSTLTFSIVSSNTHQTGILDPNTRDWTDGLLSNIFREINRPLPEGTKARRYILYDGDVDALWIENMNSVMDDNKLLTLANSERIRLQNYCAMLFEVGDLQYASPATVSRCGMVYVDPKNLGYEPYWLKWANQLEKSEEKECLKKVNTLRGTHALLCQAHNTFYRRGKTFSKYNRGGPICEFWT